MSQNTLLRFSQQLYGFIKHEPDGFPVSLAESATHQRYLLLARNNHCAALLLELFYTAPDEQVYDCFTASLQQLQQQLPHHFSLKAISTALHFLLQDTYIFLAPYAIDPKRCDSPNNHLDSLHENYYSLHSWQKIDTKDCGTLTFLIDQRKISLLGHACDIHLSSPDEQMKAIKSLERQYRKERGRVVYQSRRATIQQLPATLLLFQWICTLEYFHWRCAYCQEPFSVLEHYVPLEQSAGTQWSNCVPACQSCNAKKGPNHPSLVTQIPSFSRVDNYLRAIRHIEELLQLQAQERAAQARRERLQKIDAMDRTLIQSVSLDRQVRRLFWSVKSIRLTGWLCGIMLCGIIPAPWWLALQFYQQHDWSVIVFWTLPLFLCLVGVYEAIETLDPKKRHKIEARYVADIEESEVYAQQLTQLALEKQEQLQALEEKNRMLRMSPSDPAEIKRRFLANLEEMLQQEMT